MPTCVRSYSKINLGLAIGPPRADGFHSLQTLYQTLALYDLVTVAARLASKTRILLTSSDPRVPTDARNTAFKMVTKMLAALHLEAEVRIHIKKTLPMQGGMGAGSANAAAALIGLERELSLDIVSSTGLEVAARVGSDVPLFLIGGSVLGTDRGQEVRGVSDLTHAGQTEIPCVVALPGIGVSTPQAFRDWDRRAVPQPLGTAPLHQFTIRDTFRELSRTYASIFPQGNADKRSGASGIYPDSGSDSSIEQNSPENLHGLSREQRHTTSEFEIDRAENSLLALVRTGIENDFEQVVFPQNPLLGEIKRQLMGSAVAGGTGEYSAVYAALSGSGSALFGLYGSQVDAHAAQQRLQQHGVRAIVTTTMPRTQYWGKMFAE